MSFTRWYDKDKFSGIIVEILELMEDDARLELANELVQIIFLEGYIEGVDGFIEKINAKSGVKGRRWYDTNPTLCSAVEMLKFIDISKKKDLLKNFVCSLMCVEHKDRIKRLVKSNELVSRY